jgi:hypothetical protein
MMALPFVLAAARLSGSDDIRLIEALRAERGVEDGPTTDGQLALARWMLGEMGGDFPRSNLLGGISDELVIRFLTGEAEPDYDMAQFIADKTRGAVMPQAWARAANMPERADADTAQLGGATGRLPLPHRSPHFSAAEMVWCGFDAGSEDAAFGAMLVRGNLLIVGPNSTMTVPAADFRPLFNQMGPLLSTIENGAPG